MTNSRRDQAELSQERFALKIAARLSDASEALPHDIAERLRHARSLALARQKTPHAGAAAVVRGSAGALNIGGQREGWGWWQRVGAALPVLALLLGLVAIESALDDHATQELANVDTALLMDDLPPAAYADPGFGQFLKSRHTPTP